jgi:hypothetical protein
VVNQQPTVFMQLLCILLCICNTEVTFTFKARLFLLIMCIKSDPVSILSTLFLFVLSVGIHFLSCCNHNQRTFVVTVTVHGSYAERKNDEDVQAKCRTQGLTATY